MKLFTLVLLAFMAYASSGSLLNEIPVHLQTGNICVTSDECYPINWFNNVCCVKYGAPGQCCNMFSYISLNPFDNFIYFNEKKNAFK